MSLDGSEATKKERIAALFHTKKLSDCMFIIGDEKIQAHKLLLAISSPVFESMFYGPMAALQVEITDIDSSTFKMMLEYIYIEKATFSSIPDTWSLYYASQKYCLQDLSNDCLRYISENSTLSTLFLSYEYAQLYDLNDVAEKCWTDVLNYAKELLKLDYHMKSSTLLSLVKEDCLNATEHDLIEAANKWSEEECLLKGIAVTAENKREVLKEEHIFQHLRLLLSDIKHLNMFNFFSPFELCFPNSDVNQCVDKRLQRSFSRKYRFRDVYKLEHRTQMYGQKEYKCMIKSNRTLLLCGMALIPTFSSIGVNYDEAHISITNNASNRVVFQREEPFTGGRDIDSYRLINLLEFLIMEENTPYTLSVKYVYSSTQYILSGHLSSTIKSNTGNTTITFYNENCSGLIGLSYYPIT